MLFNNNNIQYTVGLQLSVTHGTKALTDNRKDG